MERDAEVPAGLSSGGSQDGLSQTRSGQRRSGVSTWAFGRPGPTSREETFESISAAVLMMKANAALFGEVNLFENLVRSLADGVRLATDFSGMGGAEQALAHVASAVQRQDSQQRVFNISCTRATDKAQHCQQILVKGLGVLSPKCVFGDILERMPDGLRLKLLSDMETSRKAFQRLVDRSADKSMKAKKKIAKEKGSKFFAKAIHQVQEHISNHLDDACTGYCHKHHDHCHVFNNDNEFNEGLLVLGAITILVAGINCYDWSTRGSQEGWLGDSCLSFLEILREVMARKPDMVIFECVPLFDEEGLAPLHTMYDIRSLVYSPVLFGLPCSRPRKYMLMVSRSSYEWIPQVNEFGHMEMFEALFARSLQLYGHELFCAPLEMVQEMRTEMARARGLPPKRPTGKDWSFFQALPPGIRSNVRQYRKAGEADPAVSKPLLITATQRPRFQSRMEVCPAILRKTCIWSTQLRRPAHTLELFEIMGYMMFDNDAAGTCTLTKFGQAVQGLPPKDAASLAGNGMHVTAMAAAYLFIMGCSRRKAP